MSTFLISGNKIGRVVSSCYYEASVDIQIYVLSRLLPPSVSTFFIFYPQLSSFSPLEDDNFEYFQTTEF